MPVKHRFASAVSDGADATLVQPGDWNDDHKWDLPVALGAYVAITNVGASYDAVDLSRGCGRVENDWTGVTEIRVNVSVKHVGSGNLTWQLWNETDSAAIGTISDTNNTAWHTVSGTFTTSLPTGIKILRLRVLSNTAGDDPVYGGSTLLARRTT